MTLSPALCVVVAIAGSLAAPALAFDAQSGAQAPQLPAWIALEDTPASTVVQVLDRAGTLPFKIAGRVVAAGLEDADVDARLAALTSRGLAIWLAVPAPRRVEDVEAWRMELRRQLDRYGRAITVLEILIGDQPAPVASFALQLAWTEARATPNAAVRVAVGGERMADDATRAEIYTPALAPYVDLLSIPQNAAERAATWLSRVDPTASLVATTELGRAGSDATRELSTAILRFSGSRVVLFAGHSGAGVAAALQAVSIAARLMTDGVEELADSGVSLTLSSGGADAASTVVHRLLFDSRTFATYLAYWGPPQAAPLVVSIRLAAEGTPVVYDLVAGSERAIETVSRTPSTRTVQVTVPLTGGPMLIDFNRGAVDAFGQRSEVVGIGGLTVNEVIARYQASQRVQDARLVNYIALARMEQHFRPTVADPGYDVVSENRYFVAGTEVEWEELSFSVNGSRWGADRPPFPLLQPEKVLSLPLQLRFDEGYRYRLEGAERVSGYDCYVVRFEPTRADASLYRGTVWIDRQTFARIRVQAVQSRLQGPVVSNEEVLQYAPPVMAGDQSIFLLHSLNARQIVLIAGRNLLVEKSVTFDHVRPNVSGFEAERNEARRGDRVMFRETPGGLRYYVKQGETRVISDSPTQHAKAMAMGVTIDPSYAFPLPIFGINYLDFDFGGADTQLALLFAGVLAAGNVQRTSLSSTPFDASIDFFAIAVPSSDRLYDGNGELEAERLLTWPLSTGLNLGWQYSAFQKVTAQYQFRFDGFVRDRTTSGDFAVPSSTVTNGLGVAWEYRRGGYTLVVNGTEFRRATWRPWGAPGTVDAEPSGPRYAKYSANLSRDFYFNIFHKIHLNGAWFGGNNLDRFSKYQFGMFDDTRVHGVPASGIRFEDLAMARGSYSLNIFEQYRLDLFVEEAWGRDRSVDADWHPILGLGVAVNFRAPKSTILRADFGKSFLPPHQSNVGSYTLQVLILKPLR